MNLPKLPDFPIFGPAEQGYPQGSQNNPHGPNKKGRVLIDIGRRSSYPSFCDPDVTTLRSGCIEEWFPYYGETGYQPGNQVEPLTRVSSTPVRRPYPFYEYGCMGLYQVQYPNTQYADTKSPYGIDKVYGGSFGEWVMGPWIMAITQEVYHQFNSSISNPWQGR